MLFLAAAQQFAPALGRPVSAAAAAGAANGISRRVRWAVTDGIHLVGGRPIALANKRAGKRTEIESSSADGDQTGSRAGANVRWLHSESREKLTLVVEPQASHARRPLFINAPAFTGSIEPLVSGPFLSPGPGPTCNGAGALGLGAEPAHKPTAAGRLIMDTDTARCSHYLSLAIAFLSLRMVKTVVTVLSHQRRRQPLSLARSLCF